MKSLDLLDFHLEMDNRGKPSFSFFKKAAKRDLFPHFHSAIPISSKRACIRNEANRITMRCTEERDRVRKLQSFQRLLSNNGYPPDMVHMTLKKQVRQQKKDKNTEDPVYFNMPFFNDSTHWKIKKIFKEANLPVLVYNKCTTLKDKLRRRKTPTKCETADCSMSDSGLCFRRRCVYKMTCTGCKEFYIGSTIRHLHTRVREHLKSDKSSIFQHHKQCKNTFEVAIITRSQDFKCLRFKEAIAIQERNPQINSRGESDDLSRLTF